NSECLADGLVPTRYSVTCPITCVASITQCPKNIVDPVLANCTKTVCADGTCQSDCSTANLNPVCNCPRGFNIGNDQVVIVNPLNPLVPCSLTPQVVDVEQYLQDTPDGLANANLPLWNACTKYANANVTSKGTTFNITSTSLYNECAIPSPSDRTAHLSAPEFLVAYVLFGMELGVLLLHFLYKKIAERNFRDIRRPPLSSQMSRPKGAPGPRGASLQAPSSPNKRGGLYEDDYLDDGVGTELEELVTSGSAGNKLIDPNLTFKGYQQDPFGAAASATATITSLLWLILLAVLVLDYYSVFAQFGFREESDMIFYDHSLLSKVFILVWHFVTIWFIALKILENSMDSYFGRRVPLSHAAFIVVEKRTMEAVTLANQGALVTWVRKTEAAIQRITGYYAYYYMGLVLTFVIVVSGVGKVVVFLRAQRRVLSMANFTGTIRAMRDGAWTLLTTDQLVPGDVVEIVASEHVLPVDAVLVEGGAVCDESSLTGEALPVVKFAVRDDATAVYRRDSDLVKGNSLFAGCHVMEAQPATKGRSVMAIVTGTGAMTSKGRLVKDILFPSPVSFVFNEHLKVVFPLLIVWGFMVLTISVFMLGTSSVDSWFYGMMSISQVLSPLLPAVLVIGQSVAAERLAKKGILCVDLDRITLSGKIKVYCFDKTGTLTKEGLNFLGVQPVAGADPGGAGAPAFGRVLQEFGGFPDLMRRAMLTCHSVSMIGNRPVGNFVDVEMFRATGAALSVLEDTSAVAVAAGASGTMVHPITQGDRNLHIVKRFEFVHSNAYMTVLVRDPIENRLYVFLKGSFEKIRDLCHPSTIPANFNEVSRFHASEGCYVLAFACRQLPASTSVEEAVRLTRDVLENAGDISMRMLGLCLFRNELKPDTGEALENLRDGGCRVVMITGDNADTAVFVARKCGMIRATESGEPVVVMGDIDKNAGPSTLVEWRSLEAAPGSVLDERELQDMLSASRRGHGRPVELAVTGRAFNALQLAGKMRDLLLDTRIFARMLPEDKVNCVRLHMERAVTGMCGDGGNDAGALKAAHSGIALSEAESSVVSHFSSRNRSVMSCVELLREARCSLDVSFASYKYLIMYGEVLSFMGFAQYYFTVNMSQAMWILIDGTTVPLSWALTQARAAARLARTRPTARLLGPETITSVLGQILINCAFIVGGVALLFAHRSRGGFLYCNEFDGRQADVRRWWELADNFEGEVTGILGMFQIVNAAFAFNIGSRYRAGWLSNWVFLLAWGAVVALLSCITLLDPNPVGCLFHVNCGTSAALARLNRDASTSYRTDFYGVPSIYHSFAGHNVMPAWFRWQLWALAMGNLLTLALFEGVVVLGVGRRIAKRLFPLRRLEYRT
ncbi:hypothetical protein HK405_006484, partial [Cladochytrium tenue]